MYRTVVFKSTFPDEWVFDENENPIAPGSRELAEAIVERLRSRVKAASAIDQHEFYGWGFYTETDRASYYNVLNPAGGECYLTVSMHFYFFKMLLLRRPRALFDSYCLLLTDVLKEIPQVSEVKWQEYRT